MNWVGPLVGSALGVGAWLGAQALLNGRGDPPSGVVRYSAGKKILAVAVTFLPLIPTSLALATAENLKLGERRAIELIIAVFLAMGLPMVVEYFGVRHTF